MRDVVLGNEELLGSVLHQHSDRLSRDNSFGSVQPPDLTAIRGMEDCLWLFSSNELNHGLSRLELNEAAYLYRLVRSLADPAVGEIGRFKGGSTFLLASAGARLVVSVDHESETEPGDAAALAAALSRFALRDRVEIISADSRTVPLEGRTFDVIFVDGDHSYEGVQADFEHWWPALAPGGHLVFHDAVFAPTDPRWEICIGVARLTTELEQHPQLKRIPDAPGSFAHFVRLDNRTRD